MKTESGASSGVKPLDVDAHGTIELTLIVNGRAEHVRTRSDETILQVLRDELNLRGVREGCGVGMCGACRILLDGMPVSGCLLLAPMAVGHEIAGIEVLTPSGHLSDVQQAFADHTGFQCSYLAGNLCRCGSYVKILASVLDARDRLREAPSTARAANHRL
jgi:aerobic-type carbon monoxide dehydrogenase small subunit (CoxS/CutS family)